MGFCLDKTLNVCIYSLMPFDFSKLEEITDAFFSLDKNFSVGVFTDAV